MTWAKQTLVRKVAISQVARILAMPCAAPWKSGASSAALCEREEQAFRPSGARGLKPACVLDSGRGAEAPLFHGCPHGCSGCRSRGCSQDSEYPPRSRFPVSSKPCPVILPPRWTGRPRCPPDPCRSKHRRRTSASPTAGSFETTAACPSPADESARSRP